MLKNNTNSTPGKTNSTNDSMNDVVMENANGEKENWLRIGIKLYFLLI